MTKNYSSNMEINKLTGIAIGAVIEVHKELGPGLLESVYEECLCLELESREIPFKRQLDIPIEYKGQVINSKLRIDMLITDRLILELKSCEKVLPIHEAQILTYLRLSNISTGLLINSNHRPPT